MACILNKPLSTKNNSRLSCCRTIPTKIQVSDTSKPNVSDKWAFLFTKEMSDFKPLQSCSYSYSTTLELVKCLLHMIQPLNNDWYFIGVTQPCSQNQKLMDKENTTNSQRSTAPISKKFSSYNADITSLNKICLYMKDLLHASHWCLVYI